MTYGFISELLTYTAGLPELTAEADSLVSVEHRSRIGIGLALIPVTGRFH